MEEGQKTECSGNAILISRHYSRSFAPPSGPRPITRYDGATAASQRAVQQLPHKELCNRHSAARAASTRDQSADVNEQGHHALQHRYPSAPHSRAVHAKAHPAVLVDGSGRTVMVSVARGGRGIH